MRLGDARPSSRREHVRRVEARAETPPRREFLVRGVPVVQVDRAGASWATGAALGSDSEKSVSRAEAELMPRALEKSGAPQRSRGERLGVHVVELDHGHEPGAPKVVSDRK